MFMRTKLSRPFGFARRPRPTPAGPTAPKAGAAPPACRALGFALGRVAAAATASAAAGSERRSSSKALVPLEGRPCSLHLQSSEGF